MISMLSKRQKRELQDRGVPSPAIDAFETELVHLTAYIRGEKAIIDEGDEMRIEFANKVVPSSRARAAGLKAIGKALSDVAVILCAADNVMLSRMQAHSTGVYPKTSISAHELSIAISAFATGASEAANELAAKTAATGPDSSFKTYVASRVLTVLNAFETPATSTKNKILEVTIGVAFSVLKMEGGDAAKYAKAAVGHTPKPRRKKV